MELNIAAIHEAVAAVGPDRDCLVFRDRRLSWAAFTERSRRLANVLLDAGLGTCRSPEGLAGWESGQDHVALYLLNGNEYLESMIGAFKARVAPVNINYRYVAEELRYVLRDAGVRGIVVHSRFTPTLAEVLDELDDVRLVLQVPDETGLPLLEGATWYEDALAAASPELPAGLAESWSGDDLYVLYTGGTTGMPKGVLWRQADFLVAALGVRPRGGGDWGSYEELAAAARGGLRTLPCAPFMHGAAHWNALSAWCAGGTVVVQSVVDRLDAADVWSTCAREGCTALQIVGDAFARPLLDELRSGRRYELGALRHVLTGGAVLSAQNKAAFVELLPGVTVVDVLGSSEAGRQAMQSGVSSGFTPDAASAVLSEDLDRVLDPSDVDEVGWLAVAGRVPRGYLGDAAKTARTFPTVAGRRYSVPGDRVRYGADGALDLLGRDSVTINSGGEKIFAEEVEQAVKAHPAVADVVVVGRPSARWGQEVVAVVSLREGADADLSGLVEVAGEHVARYKLPKAVVFVDQVLRSPSGKADYRWAKSVAESAMA